MRGRTQGKKVMLGPKGFKTIIKNKCQVTCGHCLKMRAGRGLLADSQLPLMVGISIFCP